jgi:hypothetical protein
LEIHRRNVRTNEVLARGERECRGDVTGDGGKLRMGKEECRQRMPQPGIIRARQASNQNCWIDVLPAQLLRGIGEIADPVPLEGADECVLI